MRLVNLNQDLTQFTLSVWLKAREDASPYDFKNFVSYATNDAPDTLALGENLKATSFWFYGVAFETGYKILDGTWHHAVVTWENKNGNLLIYVDGKVLKSTTGKRVGSTVSSTGYLYLGHDQDKLDGDLNAEQAFIGLMTEFNLWNRTFTEEEVVALQNNCQSGQEGGVISWYENILQSIAGDIVVHRPSSCK